MLSAVIPTLNAAGHLPLCLQRLAGADEIIVVDGGSGDGTQQQAEQAGARLVLSPKGRGLQLQCGADAAKGNWLLFVHADTVLGRGWRRAVDRHIRDYPEQAGCFRFRLADPARQARLIERGVAARVRLFGLPYGDQGLLVSRALYDAVGGFRPLPLMEDVDLVRRIGRGRLRVLDDVAVTSSERWRRDGWVQRSGRNLLCLVLYAAGVAPERIARLYTR